MVVSVLCVGLMHSTIFVYSSWLCASAKLWIEQRCRVLVMVVEVMWVKRGEVESVEVNGTHSSITSKNCETATEVRKRLPTTKHVS